jgi:uncharacterized protein YndB with AHSA1/START domain
MIKHEVSIHLNRPVEQVFSFITDPSNLRSWQSNLIEPADLTEKSLSVGTRFREIRTMGPRPTEIQGEITDFALNQRFATRTLTKPEVTVSYTFMSDKNGTTLTYRFVMQTSGLMRLLEPLIAGAIKKDSHSDFETLKRVMES